MPTQSTTYNSRVTDEALEKRFRDTFRSQGGSELVDDLYAQGVIVPVVDFTQAATGQTLGQNLQTAWDFSTSAYLAQNNQQTVTNNAGFWQVDLNFVANPLTSGTLNGVIDLFDGTTRKVIWKIDVPSNSEFPSSTVQQDKFVVFLRSGDSLLASTNNASALLNVWTRQIATVSGDLVDPSGFTSS